MKINEEHRMNWLKKAVIWITLLCAPVPAWGGCSVGALPFQLQNNTIADATQVMADFNQITTGVQANCAAAGANLDITSLGALSTPLSFAQGGTQTYYGGTSSGVNTISISSTTPSGFVLQTGIHVVFTAGATNTTSGTFQVTTTLVKNLFRKTQSGISVAQGGELIAGNVYSVMFDGTEWIIENETIIVAEMRDFAGSTAPPGWLIADGGIVSQTTFASLFSVIGFAYGNPGGGNFNLPDTRGRVLAGLDNYVTATGAANRLTIAATGCGTAFTTLGVTCANANQSHTQVLAEIAAHNHTIADPGHVHTFTPSQALLIAQSGGIVTNSSGAGNIGSAGAVASNTTGITINNNGSGQAMPIVNPNLGVLKIIRF
jgi:microcystin-dependent protein